MAVKKMRFIVLLFVLISAAAMMMTTTTTADESYGQCDAGSGGDDAKQIKAILIRDLMVQVPVQPKPYYCNVLTQNGLQMFGFAECTGRDDVGAGPGGVKRCADCLTMVGGFLIDNCADTGAGHAWDQSSICYVRVGYNLKATCPKGTS